jgi:NAD(P)-dependent dehydrogenase (short-subunit alcohol dehydrogenase family)
VVSGASRGIGLAIAKRLASEGASISILAKTVEPHPKLPGTIHTAAEEIEEVGGRALAIVTDIRSEEQVRAAVLQTVKIFGGLLQRDLLNGEVLHRLSFGLENRLQGGFHSERSRLLCNDAAGIFE